MTQVTLLSVSVCNSVSDYLGTPKKPPPHISSSYSTFCSNCLRSSQGAPLSDQHDSIYVFSLWCLPAVLTSVSEREFIEGRRRALSRFINLVARHPFFSEDELVKTFLTFSGSVCTFGTCCLALLPGSSHNKCYLTHTHTHSPIILYPKQDVQTKLRDTYKKMGDEFMTNRIATLAKVCHLEN